jgi:hypothetical protein
LALEEDNGVTSVNTGYLIQMRLNQQIGLVISRFSERGKCRHCTGATRFLG